MTLHAQDSLPRFLRQVNRCIELQIPGAERFAKEEQKTQYYLIDIHLDSSGRIARADYLGKPNLKSSAFVNKAVDSISKAGLRLLSKNITRIIVPVFIVFSDDHSVYDLPFLPQDLLKNSAEGNTYITKDLVIGIFDAHDTEPRKTPAIVVVQKSQ